MLKKLTLFLFPLTIFSNINTSLADSDKDFDFGFVFGAVSITCEMALDKTINTEDARRELKFLVDYAKDSLDQDYQMIKSSLLANQITTKSILYIFNNALCWLLLANK